MTMLMTEQEVADRLQITRRTLHTMRAKGSGPPSLKLNDSEGSKGLRFRRQDVEAWEAGRVTGITIPEEAKKVMQRSASAFDMVLGWKDISDQARATLTSMRDDLRSVLSKA